MIEGKMTFHFKGVQKSAFRNLLCLLFTSIDIYARQAYLSVITILFKIGLILKTSHRTLFNSIDVCTYFVLIMIINKCIL